MVGVNPRHLSSVGCGGLGATRPGTQPTTTLKFLLVVLGTPRSYTWSSLLRRNGSTEISVFLGSR